MYNGSNAEFCGAKPPYGLHVTTCAKAAVATNAYVVCPFYELATPNASQDAGPTYNSAVLLDRTGAVVGKYRKSYPTATELPNAGELAEGVLPGDLGVPVSNNLARSGTAVPVSVRLCVRASVRPPNPKVLHAARR